jgi:purine nucleosidase
MQAIGAAKPPLGVIFDADLGNAIDAVLAMAVLYGLDGKNECRVVATTVSKHSLSSAAMAEVIARFYAGTVSADFGAVGRGLPVGMSIANKSADETPLLKAVLNRKTPEGNPVYNHGILQLNDTADVHAVIRNAYTSQYDQNCITVLAGPATNLAGVLGLPGVKDLIKQKCKALVWAPDRLSLDPPAAQKLLAEWPTPIYIATPELGAAVKFSATAMETNFAWSEVHPIADAYRAAQPMPYEATTAAVAAVLYAVKPEGFFTLSPAGAATLSPKNTIVWKAGAGQHHLLQLDPANKATVLETMTTLASAKPVPRAPRRRRPPVADPAKADPAKADPAKPDPGKPVEPTKP